MLTAIMSAIMSTVAALMLLIATIVSIDFYKRWLRPNASDRSVLIVSKGSIIAVGIIGVTIAIMNPPGIFSLIVDTFSFMGCAFLPSVCMRCMVEEGKCNWFRSIHDRRRHSRSDLGTG